MNGPDHESRPKRRLFTFWRVVAVLTLGLFGYGLFLTGREVETGPHVAVHEIIGIITADPQRASLLREIADDADAVALMLRIDSPGGTTAGSEELFEAIRIVADRKPVVAVLGEVAASGGYIAAMGADHIVAFGNTLTGSIGVVTQQPDVTVLLDRLGVQVRENRSDVFKASPSPFGLTPPEVLAWEKALIADAYDWFRGLVADRRGLEGQALDRVADGRVFTGRQALSVGLIDAIGGQDQARQWLVQQGIPPETALQRRELPDEDTHWLIKRLVAGPPNLRDIALETTVGGWRLLSTLR